MEQVQGELEVKDGAVAPRRQVAAELAVEQLVGGRARRRGDVGRNLGAAVDPVMDVVAQVGSEVAAVRQDVQRDAGEREQGGDVLQGKEMAETWVPFGINRFGSARRDTTTPTE